MNQTQALITSSNKTPLVQIFVWISITASVLGACARLGTKLAILKRLEWQDHLITIAVGFSICQSVAVAIECANGFGQFFGTISDGQLQVILKAEYSASLLYITSLFFAKISVVMFIYGFTPITAERIATKVIGLVVSLWAVTSILAAAFQCRPPKVWDNINGKCFNQTAFRNYSAAVNIATDASLVSLITFIALHIQTTWRRKLTLICVFGTRVCVIAAVCYQLVYSNKKIQDPTFDPWRTTICNQLVQCLSIVTACVPYLKPFLDSLESGLLRMDDLRRRGETAVEDYGSSRFHINDEGSRMAKMGKMISQTLNLRSRDNEENRELSYIVPAHPFAQSNAVIVANEGHSWDGQSQSSQSRIITKTRTWDVEIK